MKRKLKVAKSTTEYIQTDSIDVEPITIQDDEEQETATGEEIVIPDSEKEQVSTEKK